MLAHVENECWWNHNIFCFSVLGSHGVAHIIELIIKLLTTFIAKTILYTRKHIDVQNKQYVTSTLRSVSNNKSL